MRQSRPREEPRFVAGLRVLVTGAAGLLGRALVEEGARQGALVAASGREPALSAAPLPHGVVRLAADLADPAACGELVERAAAELGGLDVLVNNAAALVRRDFAELELADLEAAWAVNLRAPVLLMQAALPHLERSGAPAIVNVVSSAGFDGSLGGGAAAYAMTKAGLVVVTKSVAKQLGPRGIRALCVSPPTMLSQMQAHLDEAGRERVLGYNVLGRFAELREVALATLFAASPYASFVTGTTIDVTASVP